MGLLKRLSKKADGPSDVSVYLQRRSQVTFEEAAYEGAAPYEPSVRVFLCMPDVISLGVYNTTTLGHGRSKVDRNLYAVAHLTHNEAKQLHAILGAALEKVGA